MKPRVKSDYIGFAAFDGSGFNGWQSQTDRSGIQDHVEAAFRTFLRHDIRVIGASRTDAGVHAERQIVSFSSDYPFDRMRWLNSLRGLLDARIALFDICMAPPGFHAIRESHSKKYLYRIWSSEAAHPFWCHISWPIFRCLDLDAMRVAAKFLVGTHDFSSFCAAGSNAVTKIRTVNSIEVIGFGPVIEIRVHGTGFLKQMVRNMVGTLVDVGSKRIVPAAVKGILNAKDRKAAGATAPSIGLTLQWVRLVGEMNRSEFKFDSKRPTAVGSGVLLHNKWSFAASPSQ